MQLQICCLDRELDLSLFVMYGVSAVSKFPTEAVFCSLGGEAPSGKQYNPKVWGGASNLRSSIYARRELDSTIFLLRKQKEILSCEQVFGPAGNLGGCFK